MSIIFGAKQFNGSWDADIAIAEKGFKAARIDVIENIVTAVKREGNYNYREVRFIFADSQNATFRVRQDGTIYALEIDDKKQKIKDDKNHQELIKEIITELDKNRVSFQKKLTTAKSKLPLMIDVGRSKMVKEIQARIEQTQEAIKLVDAKIKEYQV